MPSITHNVDVRFFTKTDALRTDDDLKRALATDVFVSLKQVHGNAIVIVSAPSHRMIEADAAATMNPNVWLTIRAADCQQLLVYAPKQKMIGVIHAGWKGLKVRVIESFFEKIQAEWGIDTTEATVVIGPSLCTSCAEFTDPLTELEGLDPSFFHGRNVDLRGIADKQLTNLGIPSSNIIRSPHCTKCMNDTYWSYRGGDKEKVAEGWGNVIAAKLK